jgi:hypothetical protein
LALASLLSNEAPIWLAAAIGRAPSFEIAAPVVMSLGKVATDDADDLMKGERFPTWGVHITRLSIACAILTDVICFICNRKRYHVRPIPIYDLEELARHRRVLRLSL